MKKSRLFLLPFLFFICVYCLEAQSVRKLDPEYYRQPLDGRLLLSANFAEARVDHLHSGIDVKTAGVEGKPLYAIADGYITRIGVIPAGFGRVLYINHPNGTTSVYAHMQKFIPEVEVFVKEERYRQKIHRADLYPDAAKFPVKKGQLIGYAGNSGRSSGPHLHFEIRETNSQRTLNVPAQKIYDIKDDIPPTIVRLHYIETDTINGIPVHSKPIALDVRNVSRGKYVLAANEVLEVGPKGHFILEATDRKNDTHNTMGLYKVKTSVDGEQTFSFQIDGFLFSDQRYVNSLTHYQMQKGSRNELLRLAVQTNNKLPIYSGIKNNGALVLNDNEIHQVSIEAYDDNGNMSVLDFKVRKVRDDSQIQTTVDTSGIPLDCKRSFTRSNEGASITIPAGALYESIFYIQKKEDESKTAMRTYAPIHRFHKEEIPLHQAATVSIDVNDVPENLRSKLCLAKVSADGKFSNAGGSYSAGKVKGSVRSFGRYTVVADTTPPTISASFEDGANLSARNSISFTLRDNFSGVASFIATIDGHWIPFEQQGSVITHHFDPSKHEYTGGLHTLVITATDSKGNSTTLKRTFRK